MKYLLYIFILSLFTIQCGVYTPNLHNVPMLTEKGDGNIGAHFATYGLEGQASVAVNDEIAIMYNNMFRLEEQAQITTSYHELAIGRYGLMKKRGKLEIFAGGGFTRDYSKIFIQPNIGVTWNALELAFSTRVSQVFLSSHGKKHTVDDDKTLEHAKPTLFFEPAATVKLGLKSVKFMVQTGVSLPVSGTPEVLNLPVFMSMGININLKERGGNSSRRNPFM